MTARYGLARRLVVGLLLLPIASPLSAQFLPHATRNFTPEVTASRTLSVELVSDDFKTPSAIAFLPNGSVLVADRGFNLLKLLNITTRRAVEVTGMPASHGEEQAGIHDVLLHPQFASNGTMFVSYTAEKDSTYTLVVDRMRLDGSTVRDVQRIFTALPWLKGSRHFGGTLAFDGTHLYVTVGDRDRPELAQNRGSHAGKTIRIFPDGRVPPNPYRDTTGARPEIFSIGHRNSHGMVIEPGGTIWQTEHGPRGGDELNRILPGRNYGWPAVTFGFDYDGGAVGRGMWWDADMEGPVQSYMPSIAPSDLIIYRGDAIPEWKGSMIFGSLVGQYLHRIVVRGGDVRLEERLFANRGWRIRAIAEAPDGTLLLGIDGGMIVRVSPASARP